MKEKKKTMKEKRISDQKNALDDFLNSKKIDMGDLSKYTVDSVHDESYRVLVSKLTRDFLESRKGRLEEFRHWEIIRKVIDPEKKIFDIDDELELPFEIPFEQVREGMVFLVSGNDWVEITDLVREESKQLYTKLLLKEHSIDQRRPQR